MGCECCKEFSPKKFAKCKVANNISYKGKYIAPCGVDFSNTYYGGSNYTPPKKKRKRKK